MQSNGNEYDLSHQCILFFLFCPLFSFFHWWSLYLHSSSVPSHVYVLTKLSKNLIENMMSTSHHPIYVYLLVCVCLLLSFAISSIHFRPLIEVKDIKGGKLYLCFVDKNGRENLFPLFNILILRSPS